MMYCKSNGGKDIRENVCSTLAWWHSYKTACYLLYKKFAKSLFAGCFHALYPSNIFYIKPSNLTSILAIFQYIRIGYPSFKAELEEAMINPLLTPKSLAHLRNIKSICEFFIPAVNIVIAVMSCDIAPQSSLFKKFLKNLVIQQ